MTTKNTGGAAFPRPNSTAPNGETSWAEDGMTLRDWFAGQALKTTLKMESFTQGESSLAIDVARAYRVADAMIAERDK